MATPDPLGRRWALRLLWELRNEPLGARALRGRCDAMPSSVLNERPRELGAAGLIGKDEARDYVVAALDQRLTAFFAEHADPRYDLWNGGSCQGLVSRHLTSKERYGSKPGRAAGESNSDPEPVPRGADARGPGFAGSGAPAHRGVRQVDTDDAVTRRISAASSSS